MFKWFRPTALDPLSVSMTGVKLGDRVLVVGCGDPRLIAALAAKAGMSGRTCAVDESPDVRRPRGADRAQGRSARRNVGAMPHALAFDRESFDLVVLRDAGTRDRRVASAGASRKRGGCCVPEGAHGRSTRWRAAAWPRCFGGSAPLGADSGAEAIEVFKAQGFVAVRTLAEREGLRFVEAVKKNH